MQQQVHFLTFAAADLGAARRVYVEGLGCTPLLDVPGEVVFFQVAPGTVLTPPGEGAFGGVFHALVRDPNGVVWEVGHNPGWSVDPDGTVRLAAPPEP